MQGQLTLDHSGPGSCRPDLLPRLVDEALGDLKRLHLRLGSLLWLLDDLTEALHRSVATRELGRGFGGLLHGLERRFHGVGVPLGSVG
jgi:hypothetical protein